MSKFLITASLTVLLLFSVYTAITFQQARQKLRQLSTPQGQAVQAQQETKKILEALKKLAAIPDEQPLVATVINAQESAKESSFYELAQNGDKLVLFQNAERAYLYRPSQNLIVNVGPLVLIPQVGQQ